MWQTFWPDVLVAAIGAALTVGIALATYALTVRRNELRALRSLVLDMYHRRVFAGQAVTIPGARETDDYVRANASVLSVKDEIRHARGNVREIPSLQMPLARMTRACNVYLEESERDPDAYAAGLIRLRDVLEEEVRKLASERYGLPVHRPGDGAFD